MEENTFPDIGSMNDQELKDLIAQLADEEREALSTLTDNGFIVESREIDRRNVEDFFRDVRESTDQLRVTVLTTLLHVLVDHEIAASRSVLSQIGETVFGRLSKLNPRFSPPTGPSS